LDPLTDAWGSKILVTSGYRCQKLNEAVGGSKTSAHSLAYAADLVPANGKIEEFKAFTMKWLYENKLVFDQYINEYSGKSSWVHLAVRNRAGN
jgi:putative chitinase